MMERISRYGTIPREPHEIRGSFQECRIKACISSRETIDADPARRTAKVTIDLANSGVTFSPGDRVVIMPLNSSSDIGKAVNAWDLDYLGDQHVTVDASWDLYVQHMGQIYPQFGNLSVRKVLRCGSLAPLTNDVVMKVTNSPNLLSNSVDPCKASEFFA
jgi:hypothetical protein